MFSGAAAAIYCSSLGLDAWLDRIGTRAGPFIDAVMGCPDCGSSEYRDALYSAWVATGHIPGTAPLMDEQSVTKRWDALS